MGGMSGEYELPRRLGVDVLADLPGDDMRMQARIKLIHSKQALTAILISQQGPQQEEADQAASSC